MRRRTQLATITAGIALTTGILAGGGTLANTDTVGDFVGIGIGIGVGVGTTATDSDEDGTVPVEL